MSADIFQYDDYKKYMRDLVSSLPKNGHGIFVKLANHLSVTPVLMSKIFNGDRELTLEQSLAVANYFSLSEIEKDFFLALVEKSRAGNFELKEYFNKKIEKIKISSRQLKEIIVNQKELSEEEKSEFYSQWYYMAIWVLTSLGTFSTAEDFKERLGLSMPTIQKAIQFLIRTNIILKSEGKFIVGPQFIFLDANSIHISKHHSNWRIKALAQQGEITEDELCFTMPCSISKADFESIRKLIIDLIKKSRDIVNTSPEEEVAFMNIDWLKMKALK